MRHVQLDRVDADRHGARARRRRTRRRYARCRRRRAPPAAASSSAYATADGASGVQPPASGGISAPPSHGRADEPLRPACASCSATGIGGACRRARARRSPSACSVASFHSPRQPGVIRPVRRHRGGLDAEHAGAGLEQLPPVHEMPVRRLPVVGRVLAHRRHDDPVAQRDAAQRERIEQVRGAASSFDPDVEADGLHRRDVGFPRPAVREGERRRARRVGAEAEGGDARPNRRAARPARAARTSPRRSARAPAAAARVRLQRKPVVWLPSSVTKSSWPRASVTRAPSAASVDLPRHRRRRAGRDERGERTGEAASRSTRQRPAAALSASTLSVASHVNSGSSRPKWP